MARKAISHLAFLLMLSLVCGWSGVTIVQAQDDPLDEARTILDTGDIDGAISKAQELIAGTEDRLVQASGYLFIGYCHLKKQDLDSAMSSFHRVATDYASQKNMAAEAVLRIGYLHIKAGNTVAAVAAFQDVIDLQPSDSACVGNANLRLVALSYRQAKAGSLSYAEAHESANAALTTFPSDLQVQGGVRVAMAGAYYDQSMPLEAIETARSALRALAQTPFPSEPADFDLSPKLLATPQGLKRNGLLAGAGS